MGICIQYRLADVMEVDVGCGCLRFGAVRFDAFYAD